MAARGKRAVSWSGLPPAILVAVALLVGCTASPGVRTQTPPASHMSSSSSIESPTPSTSVPVSNPPSSSSPASLPTPSVRPPAQAAVDAYIALANAYDRASRDPAHADLATINQYLGGKARKLFDKSIRSMKLAGQAYRGTPADPRVKVQAVFSARSVFLTSCPVQNPKDPFLEYYIATGKPVTVAKRNPPPPYRLTLPMQLIGSQWKLTDLIQNVSKTCS